MTKMSIIKNSLGVTGLMLLLSGCSALHGLGVSDSDQLKERAQVRWQALINKDWDTAYQYQLPAYRASHDVNQFRAKFGTKLQLKSATVSGADIVQENKIADVKLNLVYQIKFPDGEMSESDSDIKERWLKQDGGWWIAD